MASTAEALKKAKEPMIKKEEKDKLEGLRNSQILLLQRVPIIKGSVVSYTVDNGTVLFKILTYKDSYTMWSVKKSFQDFKDLDKVLTVKYAKYIKKGILHKTELPKESNFSSVANLE